MKIYILLDVYLNDEYHKDYVDSFDNADDVLKYIAENQSDGHKFEYIVKEFHEEPKNPLDYPWTVPTYPRPIEPMYPGDSYPLGITWQWLPCMNGGPCTNPQHDCINCPWPYGNGGTYTTSGDGTQWIPCRDGGPCTNPHHDCVACPRPYGDGGCHTSTDSTGNANGLKTIREHTAISGTDSVNSGTYTSNKEGISVTLQANGQTE